MYCVYGTCACIHTPSRLNFLFVQATTLERQLHDTREELEKAEAIAEDQRCLYNEIKKLYLFNEQRNCSEVAVLQVIKTNMTL